MARLEELTPTAAVKGVLPDRLVTVVAAKWFGSEVVELTYKDPAGNLGHELIFRDREPTLSSTSMPLPDPRSSTVSPGLSSARAVGLPQPSEASTAAAGSSRTSSSE